MCPPRATRWTLGQQMGHPGIRWSRRSGRASTGSRSRRRTMRPNAAVHGLDCTKVCRVNSGKGDSAWMPNPAAVRCWAAMANPVRSGWDRNQSHPVGRPHGDTWFQSGALSRRPNQVKPTTPSKQIVTYVMPSQPRETAIENASLTPPPTRYICRNHIENANTIRAATK